MPESGGLHIEDAWRRPLAEAGLDTFDALLATRAGECVSYHKRGQTYRVELPAGGRTVYVKRDAHTQAKNVLFDLCRLRRPQPKTWKERRANQAVAALGIATPLAVAWGQRRRWGLPHQGVLVTAPLAGVELDDWLVAEEDASRRTRVLAEVGQAVAKLYRAGWSWPDLVPRHIFLTPGGEQIGMLDLERLDRPVGGLRRLLRQQVGRFVGMLRRDAGLTGEQAEALLAPLTPDLISSVRLPVLRRESLPDRR